MESVLFQGSSRINIYDNGAFDIVTPTVGIYQCMPNVDGDTGKLVSVSLSNKKGAAEILYKMEKLDLNIKVVGNDERLSFKTELTLNGVSSIKKVSLISNAKVVGQDKILAHGYFSWDQSDLISAENLKEAKSHGVTVIVGGQDNLVIGYLNHTKTFQTFNYSSKKAQTVLSTDLFLEGKDLTGIKTLSLSELILFSNPDLYLGQAKWAKEVAKDSNLVLTKPHISGWCSWYYDYFWFSGQDIETYMKEFKPFKEEMHLNVFVMDANYFAHLGDWLETNDKFPKGLEYYAKLITENGYTPGIWVGPWMVGDRSRLFKEHPEWMVRDVDGNLIEYMSPLGEDNVWSFRDKIHYCLDTSNPEAFAYLRNVFRTLRKWGFKYFKTDFMYWGSMDRFEGGWHHEGVNAHNFIKDREKQPIIKRHTPGKTRVEYFVDVVSMIREEAGPESTILGCGQPMLMSLGNVDCMRISRDVGARWVAHNSPKELLNDLQLRNYANGIFFQVDPDCALLRHFEHKLTDFEIESLALYMGVSQGMTMTSDPIHLCRKDRIELFKFIQAENDKIEFRPPLLGKETDIIVYTGNRKDSDLKVLFTFNNSEVKVEKTLQFSVLGFPSKNNVFEWKHENEIKVLTDEIKVELMPHQTKLFYVKETPFEKGYKPTRISG